MLSIYDRDSIEFLAAADVWAAFCASPFMPDGPLHEAVIGDRLRDFLVLPADCGGLGATVGRADFEALMRFVVGLKRSARKANAAPKDGDDTQVTHGH